MAIPVDGKPVASFDEVDRSPMIEALRRWATARQAWELEHGWPTGTVDRLMTTDTGWRCWVIDRGGVLVGPWSKEPWPTRAVVAQCEHGPAYGLPPHEPPYGPCECGLRALPDLAELLGIIRESPWPARGFAARLQDRYGVPVVHCAPGVSRGEWLDLVERQGLAW